MRFLFTKCFWRTAWEDVRYAGGPLCFIFIIVPATVGWTIMWCKIGDHVFGHNSAGAPLIAAVGSLGLPIILWWGSSIKDRCRFNAN